MRRSVQRIIGREVLLVKTLHAIGNISSSNTLDSARRVRLEREFETPPARERAAGAADAGERDWQVKDVSGATVDALAAPLDFPPLSAAIVPGDRIAIALDEAVPRAADVVRGAVESLRSAGIDDDAVSVVTRDVEASMLCRDELFKDGESTVKFVVHDPSDESDLCFVGVTRKHGPLVINRAIFDADVVLPVGCARLHDAGVYDSLFPRFSNAETIERFQSPSALESEASQADRARQTEEAGWLIGAPLVIEVVPGTNESVAHVIAGEPHSVAHKVEQLSRQQWRARSPQRASLVIATLTGGPHTQDWNNVGRALAAAERLVEDGGAIAICSDLEQPLGESLGRLIGAGDLEAAERKLFRDHGDDSWTAWRLARALQRGPVYFLSQLDCQTVEDLGMAPVADVEELSRLASRHDSFIVLDDAQHTVPTVAGEEDES